MAARERLIVALDYPERTPALALVDSLGHDVLWYKVGLELYLAEGGRIVEELRGKGKHVFLDLKLHDIPNTVAGAVRSVARLGPDLLTIHAMGGPAMVQAAVSAAAETSPGLKIIAVTVLTSMNQQQLRATGSYLPPERRVRRLATMAMLANAHGIVCSPQEVAAMREIVFPKITVVPGIRPADAAADDQSRTATARQATIDGASMLVVGRPITRASDPLQAARALLLEMDTAFRS
ncbi:orotidine-5'-phosphate decarboxylase [Terriglobus aquaticus]|uniref:Orotidine 5'-phosphate decarboxylase n=1 Tax=Terriglobus aquaticus TaxID=940139 RepID=A0ABW9KJ88_9BACT|nr:orotidine-5'-phosphate decarboxylase [Terriglobus aquaticus]